jgi:hypothetical protein
VPLKVSLFIWIVFNKRILIKDNLYRRGVMSTSSLLCSGDCGDEDSIIIFSLDVTSSIVFASCSWVVQNFYD